MPTNEVSNDILDDIEETVEILHQVSMEHIEDCNQSLKYKIYYRGMADASIRILDMIKESRRNNE